MYVYAVNGFFPTALHFEASGGGATIMLLLFFFQIIHRHPLYSIHDEFIFHFRWFCWLDA